MVMLNAGSHIILIIINFHPCVMLSFCHYSPCGGRDAVFTESNESGGGEITLLV